MNNHKTIKRQKFLRTKKNGCMGWYQFYGLISLVLISTKVQNSLNARGLHSFKSSFFKILLSKVIEIYNKFSPLYL